MPIKYFLRLTPQVTIVRNQERSIACKSACLECRHQVLASSRLEFDLVSAEVHLAAGVLLVVNAFVDDRFDVVGDILALNLDLL